MQKCVEAIRIPQMIACGLSWKILLIKSKLLWKIYLINIILTIEISFSTLSIANASIKPRDFSHEQHEHIMNSSIFTKRESPINIYISIIKQQKRESDFSQIPRKELSTTCAHLKTAVSSSNRIPIRSIEQQMILFRKRTIPAIHRVTSPKKKNKRVQNTSSLDDIVRLSRLAKLSLRALQSYYDSFGLTGVLSFAFKLDQSEQSSVSVVERLTGVITSCSKTSPKNSINLLA